MEWYDIEPRLNILVGPNGAGKTNLFNAIRAIADIVSGRNRDLWQQASHRGSPSPAYRIELDVEWNADWEKKVLTAFMAAALAEGRTLMNAVSPLVPESYTRFSQFVL